MTLITCIVISTKTLDAIMNDKVNYRLSMLEGNGLNIVQWVADFQGSDFISYLFLYISAYLFGVNNEAFAFFILLVLRYSLWVFIELPETVLQLSCLCSVVSILFKGCTGIFLGSL